MLRFLLLWTACLILFVACDTSDDDDSGDGATDDDNDHGDDEGPSDNDVADDDSDDDDNDSTADDDSADDDSSTDDDAVDDDTADDDAVDDDTADDDVVDDDTADDDSVDDDSSDDDSAEPGQDVAFLLATDQGLEQGDLFVLLGNGDGTLQLGAGRWACNAVGAPFDVIPADLDQDGILDLVMADAGYHTSTFYSDGGIRIFTGRSDGTFWHTASYSGLSPHSAALADVNLDGNLDIVYANYGRHYAGIYPLPGGVSVLLGDGAGGFETRIDYTLSDYQSFVAIGQFNADAFPDLAVANQNGNDVSILLGNGDGTFQAAVNYSTGTTPMAIAIGDLNNDDQTDLVVANYGSNDLSILAGSGDGTFQPETRLGAGIQPRSVVVAALNFDANADLAVANQGSNEVWIFMGLGDGTFLSPQNYAVGAQPLSLALDDLDGNGTPDVVVANNGDGNVSILLGDRDGTFRKDAPTYDVEGWDTTHAAAGDLNNDGHPDLAVVSAGGFVSPIELAGDILTILPGNGDGTFQDTPKGIKASDAPAGVTQVDLNSDGYDDLATAYRGLYQYGAGGVAVFLDNGDGTFRSNGTYPTGDFSEFVVAADLNGDGHPDLAVTNRYGSDISILLGDGHGSFKQAVHYEVCYEPRSIAAADLNGDGNVDLAVASQGYDTTGFPWTPLGCVTILPGRGDGTFGEVLTYETDSLDLESIAIADLNGDLLPDLIVANHGYTPYPPYTTGGSVLIFLNEGTEAFPEPAAIDAGDGPGFIVVGDFNRDGKVDLAVANQYEGSDTVAILLGNGDGTFQAPSFYPAGVYPTSLALGDLNADDLTDLVVGSDSSELTILLGNGDGSFQDLLLYDMGLGGGMSVAVGHFN